MIENEIIKHAKKTFSIFRTAGGNLKSKLTDIIIEILIIIAAVTISIWFHNWSQLRHDRIEEKEFLTGLKADLQRDIENLKSSKDFYNWSIVGMNYFTRAQKSGILSQDSISICLDVFLSSTNLDPNIGRYEALKSSGKFKIIENSEMLNKIILLHEFGFKRIEYLDEMYYQHNKDMEKLIARIIEFDSSGKMKNGERIVTSGEFRLELLTGRGLVTNNIIPLHEAAITTCGEVITQINKELGLK
jgi:hypothetical protein